MTQEEKAKAYDEALKVLHKYDGANIMFSQDLKEEMFPELKESEYDKTKRMLDVISYKMSQHQPDIFTGEENEWFNDWIEKQCEPIDKGEISDGYHTFNELYYYRMLYNAAFFNLLPKNLVHKSKKHHDGEECFGGGWFIVMANLPTGQISNHYELKYWDLFSIPEKEFADKWDGHTPQEAAERLRKYLRFKQCERFKYWKPSEKQLEALDYAYNSCPDTERGNYYEGVLETLIDDLYKLSEKQC